MQTILLNFFCGFACVYKIFYVLLQLNLFKHKIV